MLIAALLLALVVLLLCLCLWRTTEDKAFEEERKRYSRWWDL